METSFKFKHDKEQMNEALGYSKKDELKAVEIILFSSFSNYFLGKELFDDSDSIPKALTTVTGDLEKCLSLVESEAEKEILLLNFYKTHDLALECIGKYKLINANGDDSIQTKKLQILMQLVDLKFSEEVSEGEGIDTYKAKFLAPNLIMKRIDLVKNSKYNFSKYQELLRRENLTIEDE